MATPIYRQHDHYRTLLPQQLSLITYPYEWCFEQLKQAALLTLEIMKIALDHGMILKDATPFNIQFVHCKPVFIDSLSFEKYIDGTPWDAYKQFCETFLSPLSLMAYIDTPLQKLLQAYPSGIAVKTAAALLPWDSYFNTGTLLHIHFASKLKGEKGKEDSRLKKISRQRTTAIINNLTYTIKSLSPRYKTSTWNVYYTQTILSAAYLQEKETAVRNILEQIKPKTVIDIGANDGYFTNLAAEYATKVIAIDADEKAIERLFLKHSPVDSGVDVLVADIANPSPALGAMLKERSSLLQRIKGDTVLALAVIHHLVITAQLSMDIAAELLAQFGDTLVIEFPLPEDEKVQLISKHVKDLSLIYSLDIFRAAFEGYFSFTGEVPLISARRIIYTLKRKHAV